MAAGADLASSDAGPVVEGSAARYAHLRGRPDDAALRRRLLRRPERAHDPRRDRHRHLLAVVDRWSVPQTSSPVLDRSGAAVRARSRRTACLPAAGPRPGCVGAPCGFP
ncbi:hypothetical protein [Kitasatospora sp. NPDC090308]|uniref:hypothetical protein n=1 Tax=Kitasatospora sp. NPDC090308 TaxID=3364082 RepID=UPI0037FE62AD